MCIYFVNDVLCEGRITIVVSIFFKYLKKSKKFSISSQEHFFVVLMRFALFTCNPEINGVNFMKNSNIIRFHYCCWQQKSKHVRVLSFIFINAYYLVLFGVQTLAATHTNSKHIIQHTV